ncbi:hypothetical protein Apre_1791 (plasmid) [Anaerococcus prevotii DSM 20548]|uniref:Uncharacterized protein n=1 Tax=Anaerococcus prevotii (strain ATCC 9321 / DSM 20548 / JCM 6508 / NCTC 11806 / PC1) TaxID=525919 RepID=C7RI57_ANAPD|nr:hypothetical protein [Anaerococcus prevotii]ACV29803.1 hypothetical protein Apre_1791 [Anaerococcus prevotii DSM 20548]
MKLDLTTGEATIPREIEYIYPCIFRKEDIKTFKISIPPSRTIK